jgi:flagellar basal body P-ring formation protein FlgA
MIRTLSLLLGAALTASPALAAEFEDFDLLDQRVAELAATAQAVATPIDRRIKLRACPESATLEATPTMIAIRCASLGWRLRVPLQNATAAVKTASPVIRRGEAVNVMIVGESYEVSYDGTAMDDGPIGANIRVKFPAQASFLTGTVTAPGKVQIND